MQDLPNVGLGKVSHHVLRKDPVGDGGALNDLGLEKLVDQNDHHLVMAAPEVVDGAKDVDLRLLSLGQHLEGRVELGDGGERVRETLRSEVEQRLHEDVDPLDRLLWIVVRNLLQDFQTLLLAALRLDGVVQLGSDDIQDACNFKKLVLIRSSRQEKGTRHSI